MPLLNTSHTTFDEKWANVCSSENISSLPGITFAGLNVRSLVQKLDDVHELLRNSELDFLGLCEVRLIKSII